MSVLKSTHWRGVNLGGWLVLEKWMTPSLFAGLKAEDETAWCLEMAEQAESKLRAHWQSFMTEADFAWLAAIGINAVRIPVGHWLFAADYPYHPAYGTSRYPYVTGGLAVLDQAMRWAEHYQLAVMLDLHAAPGCQNGFDNGGIKDVCDWQTMAEYRAYSVQCLERLAQRYADSPALVAIEVLNEPRWDVPTPILADYTEQAYHAIRRHCPASQVTVVFHDGFRHFKEYGDLLRGEAYANVAFDLHRYQCFNAEDVNSDIFQHIQKTVVNWRQEADELILHSGRDTVVGEWSLGLNPQFEVLWAEQPQQTTEKTIDAFQQDLAYRAYAASQLACFEKYRGWFFWSYKTETLPQWSFRDCVQLRWLPAKFI